MGVRTAADENITVAQESINKAIAALSEIVVNGCWGSDEFRKEYSDCIEYVFHELLKLRKVLK